MPVISLLAHSDSIIWTFSPYCHHNHRKHSHHHKYIYHSRQITAFTAVFLLIIGWVAGWPVQTWGSRAGPGSYSPLTQHPWLDGTGRYGFPLNEGWLIWIFVWMKGQLLLTFMPGNFNVQLKSNCALTGWTMPNICCLEWRVSWAKVSFSSVSLTVSINHCSIPSHEKGIIENLNTWQA